MTVRKTSVTFKNPEEFLRAMFEKGNTVVSENEVVSRCDADFASARMATYRLFGLLDLHIFEITPHVDIEVPYEFSGDSFEIAYGVRGSFSLSVDGCDDSTFHANSLYLSPKCEARGREFYHRDRLFKTVSFNVAGDITDIFLSKFGWERLWNDAIDKNYRSKKTPLHLTAAPPDIAGSFIQIAACNYPDMCKRPFFESKFMEIISRFIANEMPRSGGVNDKISDAGEFENSQIEKIPGILMERLGSPPSIADLARGLSLNTTTMKRSFKKMFGEPIFTHHRNTRLELAATMLLDTRKSILEISMDTGYSDCGNFCRAFKNRYGVSPNQYRIGK
jgi:AraC-like DNA-binding protein